MRNKTNEKKEIIWRNLKIHILKWKRWNPSIRCFVYKIRNCEKKRKRWKWKKNSLSKEMLSKKLMYRISTNFRMQETSCRHEFRVQTKHSWEIIQTTGLSESITYGDCNLEINPNRKDWCFGKLGTRKW